MESGPATTNPFEAPSLGSDKGQDKDKSSKSKSFEAPAIDNKKQQAERDIARSLDRLFQQPELPNANKPSAFDNREELTEDHTEKAEQSGELSAQETVQVQQAIAREHLDDMVQAPAEATEELAPAAEFLQLVTDGTDTETAFSEVAAEAGMDQEAIDEALASLPEEADPDSEDEPEEAPSPDPDSEPESGFIDSDDGSEGTINWHPSAAASSGGGTAGGAGGGGSTGSPTPPLPPMGGPPAQPPSQNGPAVPNSPNRGMPAAANRYYYARRRSKGPDVLATGIASYLLGRRHGRRKAEKRLLPLQRKLEKQVVSLERDITHKEQQLVVAKRRQPETTPAKPAAEPTTRAEILQKNPVERTQPGRRETRIGLEKPIRAERLGQMVINAEAPTRVVERTRVERPDNIRQAFRPEEVKTMHRNELLELSEKIVIEGASLRRIYESRLIGEKQLRHLVGEYLAGKDIRRDLRREMVEREIDFERDPLLRDRVRSHLTDSGGGALNDLLANAGALPDENADYNDSRKAADARYEAAKAAQKAKRRRRTTDTAMVTVIVVLALVVIFLVVGR